MVITRLPHSVAASELPLEQLAKNPSLSEGEKIGELSRQFEAMLLRQILGEAQKSVIKSGLTKESSVSGIYQDMVTNQLADSISKTGSFGFAQSLEKELTRQLLHKKSGEEEVENGHTHFRSRPAGQRRALRRVAPIRRDAGAPEEQQEHVLSRAAEEVLRSVAAMNSQMAVIQTARQKWEAIQAELAQLLQQPGEKTFEKLIPLLPEKYRLAVAPLVRENNELLVRVQQRTRQNHLLRSRSLELMQ